MDGCWWLIGFFALTLTGAAVRLVRKPLTLGPIIFLVYSILGITLVGLYTFGMSKLQLGPRG